MGGPQLQSHVTFQLRDHLANSKNLYLHFCNTCGHQTWNGGNLSIGRPHICSQVTFWSSSHVTIVKPYIWSSAISMVTKLGRVITFGWGPDLQSHMTFWLHGHVANEKNLYLHPCSTYCHQTWQSGNLWLKDPTH